MGTARDVGEIQQCQSSDGHQNKERFGDEEADGHCQAESPQEDGHSQQGVTAALGKHLSYTVEYNGNGEDVWHRLFGPDFVSPVPDGFGELLRGVWGEGTPFLLEEVAGHGDGLHGFLFHRAGEHGDNFPLKLA